MGEFAVGARTLRVNGWCYMAGWCWINYWPNFLEGMCHKDHAWKLQNHPDRKDGIDGWGSPIVEFTRNSLHPYLVQDIGLLKENPGYAHGVEFWSCLVPGINTFDYGFLPGDIRFTTFMASPAIEPSIAAGRTTLMAMPYSEIGELLAQTEFDIAIFQTSAMDAKGQYSFAHSCDMPPVVWPMAERRIAFVNEQMRSLPCAESMPAEASTPETCYERAWAQRLLDAVLERTRGRYARVGKAAEFDHLSPFLAGDDPAPPYRELAEKLNLGEAAVRLLLHRMRRRYRGLLEEEIAATVSSHADAEDELGHLFRILGR